MEKQIIEVPGASDPALPFSPVVAYGSLLFVSGQVGKDKTGKLAEGFGAQVHQTMKNIQLLLKHAGSSLDHVLKVCVYLADMDKFSEFNQIYKEYFTGNYPARTTFQVGRFGPGVQIEIDVIAYSPNAE